MGAAGPGSDRHRRGAGDRRGHRQASGAGRGAGAGAGRRRPRSGGQRRAHPGARGTAEHLEGDVGRSADLRAMVEGAVDRWGAPGRGGEQRLPGARGAGGGAEAVSEEGWDEGLGVLVKSMFLAAKYALPALRRGGGGSIVNISSVHGMLMAPGRWSTRRASRP